MMIKNNLFETFAAKNLAVFVIKKHSPAQVISNIINQAQWKLSIADVFLWRKPLSSGHNI